MTEEQPAITAAGLARSFGVTVATALVATISIGLALTALRRRVRVRVP